MTFISFEVTEFVINVHHFGEQIVEFLEKNNLELRAKLTNATQIIAHQSEEIELLKKQYETLKIANALLGSEDNKRDTKLKINSLIREIDYCIAQLSD